MTVIRLGQNVIVSEHGYTRTHFADGSNITADHEAQPRQAERAAGVSLVWRAQEVSKNEG